MGKESRTEALRRRLREVQAQFLPSRAIYLPVGRRRHRVYRIAVEVWRFASCFSFFCRLVAADVPDRMQFSGGGGDVSLLRTEARGYGTQFDRHQGA